MDGVAATGAHRQTSRRHADTTDADVTTGSPPGRRVVELRVHGVSGTPATVMLGDSGPRQVAGDESGRFFRREAAAVVDGAPGTRVVEAYHWGRYTAGSVSRALWLVLLPFAMLNLARFAMLMSPGYRRTRDRIADLVLRLLGLTQTIAMVVTACYVSWEVAARQCGAQACVAHGWWLSWFTGRSPGIRVLVAALLPAVAIALVWTFGRQTFTYDPPGPELPWMRHSNGSFGDAGFWRGATQASRQRAGHVWAGCSAMAGLALGTLGLPSRWWDDTPVAGRVGYLVLAVASAVCAVTAVLIVVWNPLPGPQQLVADPRDGVRLPAWMRRMRWVSAVTAAACVWFTQVGLDSFARPGPGTTTALRLAVDTTGSVMAAILLALLGVCVLMAFGQPTGRGLRHGGDHGYPVVPPAFRPFFAGMGAWLIAALACTIAGGFSTAFAFWAARALGRPVLTPFTGPVTAADGPAIALAPAQWAAALTWTGLALLILVSALPLTAWLLRRRTLRVTCLTILAMVAVAAARMSYHGTHPARDQAEFYLAAVALTVLAAIVCLIPRRTDGFRKLVDGDYMNLDECPQTGHDAVSCDEGPQTRRDTGACDDDTPAELRRGRLHVLRAWRIAAARYRYHHALALLGIASGGAVLAAAAVTWVPPSRLGPMTGTTAGTFGVALASAHAAALIALGLDVVRKPGVRTTVGVLWDLLSFWPRVAHPLSPPPYGGRTVLSVARRCAHLVHGPCPAGDGAADAVVLSGHSQGSVITVAAVALLAGQATPPATLEGSGTVVPQWMAPDAARRTLDRLSLLTYGSQLQFIYARLFPTYLGYAQLQRIYREVLSGRWRNLYRWTDPLGGPVLSYPHHRPDAADGTPYGPAVRRWSFISCDPRTCPGHPARPGHVTFRWDQRTCPEPATHAPATHDPHPAEHYFWATGPDIRLRDPAIIVETPLEPRLPALGHGGYPADPTFDATLAAMLGDPHCPPAMTPPTCLGTATTAGVGSSRKRERTAPASDGARPGAQGR